MRIGIISGSSRKNSQSARVAKYLESQLEDTSTQTYLLDLGENPLPMWDPSIWQEGSQWQKTWHPIAEHLKACDGFIIISPEWSGMATSAIKNFFLLCSPDLIGHKAALLVGVSSSRGGAYPISELRTSSYKNTRIAYLPEHLIIRDVESYLHAGDAKTEDDAYIRKRITYALNLLKAYTKGLNEVRQSGVIDHKSYPNGM